MRKILLIVLFGVLALATQAQSEADDVKTALKQLEQALIQQKADDLQRLLHKQVLFGHSNGWIQKKEDVLKDMKSGFLVYRKLDQDSVFAERNGKKMHVREYVKVEGERNGTVFSMRLFVSQLWIKTRKGWQLQFRQSARLS